MGRGGARDLTEQGRQPHQWACRTMYRYEHCMSSKYRSSVHKPIPPQHQLASQQDVHHPPPTTMALPDEATTNNLVYVTKTMSRRCRECQDIDVPVEASPQSPAFANGSRVQLPIQPVSGYRLACLGMSTVTSPALAKFPFLVSSLSRKLSSDMTEASTPYGGSSL